MFKDLLGQAYASLKHNRRRSALTMLGMAWGIATVVLLLAYGAGFERSIMTVFASYGSNLIGVFPGRTSLQAGGAKAGTPIRFTLDDVDYLTTEIPLIHKISPFVGKTTPVQHDVRSSNTSVNGVYPTFQSIRAMEVGEGRLLSEEDEMGRARVAILGYDVKKKLFSGQPAVGDTIRVNGITFEVVGVLKNKVQDGDQNDNSQIIVPFSAMGDLVDTRYIDGIFIQYEGPNSAKVEASVREVVAMHHGYNPKDRRAVFVWNLMDDIKQFSIITTGIKILLSFIGLLTLGIGGIGLMNIMLVSVTQRTREIGVEKALGARKRHILLQFLSEALAITFAGGIAGIILAYLVSWTVGSMTLWSAFIENAQDADIKLRIDPSTLIISTLILTFVGLVSGMLPAIKAARMNPIEALRYE